MVFLYQHVNGGIVYYDKAPYASAGLLDSLYRQSLTVQDSLMAIRKNASRLEIVEVNGQPFLLVDGRMSVFQFSNGKWVDISKSAYHGYNFQSKKFVWGDTIYSFGGYGFWRMHGDLAWFDLHDRQEWELIPIESTHDIGNGVSFSIGNSLYVIHPESNNQAIGFPVVRKGMYEINLSNGQVKQHKISYTPSRSSDLGLESDSFLLIYTFPIVMIHKHKMTYKTSTLTYAEQLSNLAPHSFITMAGNNLIFQKDTSSSPVNYDLAVVYQEIDGNERPLIQSGPLKIWYALLLLPLALGYSYYYRKRSNKLPVTATDPILMELLEHKGKVLDQDQLDKIFGITDIRTSETLRGKRAQFIKKINDEAKSTLGLPLIVRIPDPKDNRRNLYQIG